MNQIQPGDIKTNVAGTPITGYFARSVTPGPGIIVLHAWWGLTPFFKAFCNRLAEEGFMVFAPDLNFGKTAQTVEEAQKIMSERDFDQTKAVAFASVEWMKEQLAAQENASNQKAGLGLIGFSMGASWALVLSSQAADLVHAVVLFYGVEGVDFSTVRAHFQGHYGGKDAWTKVEWSHEMEADMRAAGLQVEFYRYPNAGHWFFEANHPEAFCDADAALAWERMKTFLISELNEGLV